LTIPLLCATLACTDFLSHFVWQILTVFHPHGNLPSALTASSAVAARSSSSIALSTLSVDQCSFLLPKPHALIFKQYFFCRYSAMQALESQFTHPITVPRCYEGTGTPVVPGFVPAGAMLPLPRCCFIPQPQCSNIHILMLMPVAPSRHNATCEIHEETGLPVAFDCAFQVAV
jgi:hypothetical protein